MKNYHVICKSESFKNEKAEFILAANIIQLQCWMDE